MSDEERNDERPTRASRGRSRDDGDEKPSRRSRTAREPRKRGSGGWSSYSDKKRDTGGFSEREFKPGSDIPTLIKFLDPEPFDVYNQHWVEEGKAAGKTKHSFVCRAGDDYFDDDDGCPLCELGEPSSTITLFNILDLSDPRKPVNKVWKMTTTVSDKIKRASEDKKTAPLDREDVYFEITMVKKKNKTEWDIKPVKARDLEEDFDVEPFDEDELADYADKGFEDRTAITQVDSWDDLDDLAASLDD
jgi:hypothetical protein